MSKKENLYLKTTLDWSRRSLRDIKNNKKNNYKVNLLKYQKMIKLVRPNGSNILNLSKTLKISPYLLIKKYLGFMRFNKKEIEYLMNKKTFFTELENEIRSSIKNDSTFTPWGQQIQAKIGVLRETKLKEYLDQKGIRHLDEKEMRETLSHRVTPDFLFEKEHIINGIKSNWIEVKGYRGDPYHHRNNVQQVVKYRDLFGPGILVYWDGFKNISELEISIVDQNFFH